MNSGILDEKSVIFANFKSEEDVRDTFYDFFRHKSETIVENHRMNGVISKS